ncbi:MAG: ATP phosphoribosyltransferase [Magnetococcales bacterium]|nr:ATP phosphoribosyltransferase [Magnetococcales bacterium]
MNAPNQLKLGIPKGSLEKATVELFAQAGWSIGINARNYFPTVDDPSLICKLMRPQEMALYVADGTLDAALTGWDWIIERDCQDQITDVATLEYSKSSNQPCRWVLVAPENSPIQSVQDLQGKRIATELQNFTRRYLEERGVKAEVIFSWGATEAKVVEGLVDAVVEITETGSTLRAHRLRIVEELLVTRTKLIANPQAMQVSWKREKIDQIALLLKAALDARHKVLLKMNVPTHNLDGIMSILPSLTSPTVNPLLDDRWRAVETVVDRSMVRDLLPKLKEAGATGILEFDLKKVV